MDTDKKMQELVDLLKTKEVVFEDGLTADEIAAVESKFNFKFPDDLKLFLQAALPVSDKFVNWRQPLPRGLPRVPCRKV